MPSGTCVLCGCTDDHACPGGCAWIDERHQICSAHSVRELIGVDRRIALDNTATALRKPAPPASAPRAAVDRPLCWNRPRHGAVQFAQVVSGVYELVAYHRQWTAHWKPYKGRQKIIAFDKPEASCKAACEHHRLQQVADRLLENAGADDLVKRDLQGPATAFRKARRHG